MLPAFVIAAALLQTQNPALVPTERHEAWWQKRHQEAVALAKQGNYDLVFIGDSITQGFGGFPKSSGTGADTWDFYYKDRKPLNLGFSGDGTKHVLWRLDHGEMDGLKPKAMVIMIGTNDLGKYSTLTPEQVAEGVEAVCEKAHEKAPNAKELLLAIFPRDLLGAKTGLSDPANAAVRKQIDQTNKLISDWAQAHEIAYLDIGQTFLDSNGEISPNIMPDHVHPTAFGYRKWAMAMEPTLAPLLGQEPKTTDNPNVNTLIPIIQNRQGPNLFLPRHQRILEGVKHIRKVDVVFIGDSITQFFGANTWDPGKEGGQSVWDEYAAKYHIVNEGYGWDRVENVLWRVQQGELTGFEAKAIVIMIGTNNLVSTPEGWQPSTPDEILFGIQALLRDGRAKQPHAHILLLGIFPRGQTKDDPLRQKVREVDALLEKMPMPTGVRYMEIWDQFLQPDGSISPDVMSDYLHPTEKGYQIEMEAVDSVLKEWIGR